MKVANIGIFCGTFNPIHLGHLLVAESARDQFHLAKVIFVTSPRPPHRNDTLLDAIERHDMVALAVADNPAFEASTIEIERSGPSYTIDTVEQLIASYGSRDRFSLLVGADNIKQLSTWHRARELAGLVTFLVAPRFTESEAGSDLNKVVSACGSCDAPSYAKCELIEFPAVNISSSGIRKRLREGRSVLYMVPSAIYKVLLEKGHYRGLKV
jgi:nicotinate-nucleotide adenylyltransferase